jgi:hypothetical protein
MISRQQKQGVLKNKASVGSIEIKMFKNLAYNLHQRQTIIIFVHALRTIRFDGKIIKLK